jgi:hypothetical protein
MTNLDGKSLTEVGLKRTLAGKVLDVATIVDDLTSGTSLNELFAGQLGETPVLRDNDLLLTRELVLAASESFHDGGLVVVLGADREDDLTNVDTGNETVGLTESTTHTSLKSTRKIISKSNSFFFETSYYKSLPISTSTRQHLVDTGDMVRVDTDTHVEGVLTAGLGHVLVSTDTTSFKSFSGKLFVLVGDEMNAEREVIDSSLLTTKIVDSQLGVGDTTAESALGVGLVLAVTVATSGTATHFPTNYNRIKFSELQ